MNYPGTSQGCVNQDLRAVSCLAVHVLEANGLCTAVLKDMAEVVDRPVPASYRERRLGPGLDERACEFDVAGLPHGRPSSVPEKELRIHLQIRVAIQHFLDPSR